MKHLLGLTLVTLLTAEVFAQTDGVMVNYTGATRDNSAVLEANSTQQGMLVPRMTQAQRALITAPAHSLLIYQTDNTPGYYFNSGTPGAPVWQRLYAGTGSPVTGSGAATQVTYWSGPNTIVGSGNFTYGGTGNLSVFNPEGVGGEVRLGAAWGRPGLYSSQRLELQSGSTGILFGNANAEYMRLTATGNLAIGNTAGSHQLHVGVATADGQVVTVRGYSNTPGSWKGGAAFGYTGASVIMGELSGVAQIAGHNATLGAWANLAINSGGGNVGIGIAVPTSRLEVVGDALTLSGANLDMNRDGYPRSGISWYSKTYPSWSTYMAAATQGSVGPHGDLTAPTGTYVTSWALRNYIENNAGYGWTFESAANTTTPAVRFEIRASDGLFHAYGAGVVDGTLTIGGGSPAANRVLISSNGSGLASWVDQSTLTANYANLTGIPIRTAWVGVHRNFVAEQLSWKNYGNNHTIFDASASTSPQGTAVNNTDAQIAWSATYPTLMGWNGANTYGVRVDAARQADRAYYLRSPYPYNINITDATTAITLCEPNSLTSVNMHASHGLFGSWATTLTMSGYDRYGAYQIAGNYNAGTPELAIRNFVQGPNTWNSWVRVITSANIGSYGDNLGNHTATTTLNMNNQSITNATGLSFSNANPYISAASYFVAPGGAYFNSGTVYAEAAIQARGGINNDAGSFGGNVSITDDLRIQGVVTGVQGYYPSNNAIRLTPNFHFNNPAGYAMIVNWDNGAVGGGTQQFRVGNGQGTDQFYVRADGGFYGRWFGDLDDGGYYLDPNSTSNSALRIRGGALHGPNPTWGSYLLVGGDGRNGYVDNGSTASVSSTNGNLHADAASGYDMFLNYYDGNNIHFGRGTNSIRATLDGNGLYLYDGWLRPHGTSGLYFQSYGGGWNMEDGTWIRAYGSKAIIFGLGEDNWAGLYRGYLSGWNVSDGNRLYPNSGSNGGSWGYGYVGYGSDYDWYYVYSDNYVTTSARERKRKITPLDENMYAYVLDDIDKVKPTFYKTNGEVDEWIDGLETRYRPNMHLGLILDEAPDYIQDNMFQGIDLYSLSVMTLTGVKANRKAIAQLRQAETTRNDFGTAQMLTEKVWITFSHEFATALDGIVPLVNVTPTSMNTGYFVSRITAQGFEVSANTPFSFNWNAINPASEGSNTAKMLAQIDESLRSQLEVSESVKARIRDHYDSENAKTNAGHEQANASIFAGEGHQQEIKEFRKSEEFQNKLRAANGLPSLTPAVYPSAHKNPASILHPDRPEATAVAAGETSAVDQRYPSTEVSRPEDAANYSTKMEESVPAKDAPTKEMYEGRPNKD